MNARQATLVTLATAVSVTAVAAAAPDAAKQRVAITMKNLPNGQFLLERGADPSSATRARQALASSA